MSDETSEGQPMVPEAQEVASERQGVAGELQTTGDQQGAGEASQEAAPEVPPAAASPQEAAPSLQEPDAPASSEAEDSAASVPQVRRQSISLRSGSCDMHVGQGATGRLGKDLRGIVGKPRLALLVSGAEVPPELVEYERRSLVDAGFAVELSELPAGRGARTLDAARSLYGALAACGLTADDAIACVGSADAISCAVFVASTWCGGCALAAVPTALDGVIDAALTPRTLDMGASPEVLLAKGNVRLLEVDTKLLACDGADGLMGRAVMVAGAVMAGESTFSELALRADAIMGADPEPLKDALIDLVKARGRIVSSSAVAIRQGAGYGADFARALRACLPADADGAPGDALLLAEGLRIASRLAAAHQGPESRAVDLVFAQDALLERLGLPEVACELDAAELMKAFKACAAQRSNRIMPALPLDYGRVRLTAVDDETLMAHLGAWCKMRRRLARRLARKEAK